MDAIDSNRVDKKHNKAKSGAKADKKKAHDKKKRGLSNEQHREDKAHTAEKLGSWTKERSCSTT
jgi:hypothetical protein